MYIDSVTSCSAQPILCCFESNYLSSMIPLSRTMAPYLAQSQMVQLCKMSRSASLPARNIADTVDCSSRTVGRVRADVRIFGSLCAPKNVGGRRSSVVFWYEQDKKKEEDTFAEHVSCSPSCTGTHSGTDAKPDTVYNQSITTLSDSSSWTNRIVRHLLAYGVLDGHHGILSRPKSPGSKAGQRH
jgi:hypothetical protein